MIDKKDKEIKRLFNRIRLYLNGGLVTHITIKYFNELEELVLKDVD